MSGERSDNRVTRRGVLGLVLSLLLSVAGCGREDTAEASTRALRSKVGYYCTIQFRRDALGAAAATAISPTVGNFNGADVALTGLLKDVQGDYLVIAVPRPGDPKRTIEYWVPRDTILLIEWSSQRGAVG